MSKGSTSNKLGIIKTYVKKREQYSLQGKEEDAALLADKEALDLHLAVVDLVAACARNSPFGIAQAQRLIDWEELLDSLLSDAVPLLAKSHYFNLLYEVYLKKLQGLDPSQRLSLHEQKFVHVLRYVVAQDLEEGFNYFEGLVIEKNEDTPEEVAAGIGAVTANIRKEIQKAEEERALGKSAEERENERAQKLAVCGFKDSNSFRLLDANDKTEYWRYLFSGGEDGAQLGLLVFIENLYRDYTVREMDFKQFREITGAIRETLLRFANKVCKFVDSFDSFIKEETQELLFQTNLAVQKIPLRSAFKGDARRRLEADQDEEEGLNADDVDNRMSRDKIIRILRDFVIQENAPAREALDLRPDEENMVDKDVFKECIKRITGSQAAYDDIVKCIMFYHELTVEKEKQLAENVVEVVESEGSDERNAKPEDPRVKVVDFEAALAHAL